MLVHYTDNIPVKGLGMSPLELRIAGKPEKNIDFVFKSVMVWEGYSIIPLHNQESIHFTLVSPLPPPFPPPSQGITSHFSTEHSFISW